jgi:hypothetical protein
MAVCVRGLNNNKKSYFSVIPENFSNQAVLFWGSYYLIQLKIETLVLKAKTFRI